MVAALPSTGASSITTDASADRTYLQQGRVTVEDGSIQTVGWHRYISSQLAAHNISQVELRGTALATVQWMQAVGSTELR